MKANLKILTSLWFIIALAILLINDHLLKQIYGNWFTGKLSDFAGLFIFPLFWAALFPKRKVEIFCLTALLFIYWKSPYSQIIIDIWNSARIFNITRTVDYSDLMALIMLPLAFIFETYQKPIRSFKINPFIPLICAAFAFLATSRRTVVPIEKTYSFDFPKDTLINRINNIDSLNVGFGISFTNNNPDTILIFLLSQFCIDKFSVDVVVTEAENKTVNLKILSATHRCREKKSDKTILTKEVERIIIEKLKD